jgi:hypothetical protein
MDFAVGNLMDVEAFNLIYWFIYSTWCWNGLVSMCNGLQIPWNRHADREEWRVRFWSCTVGDPYRKTPYVYCSRGKLKVGTPNSASDLKLSQPLTPITTQNLEQWVHIDQDDLNNINICSLHSFGTSTKKLWTLITFAYNIQIMLPLVHWNPLAFANHSI